MGQGYLIASRVIFIIGIVAAIVFGVLVLSLFLSTPESEEFRFVPSTSAGYQILDEVACDANIGCVWGIDRAYCLPGYTGPICELSSS